ncbi:geranylgeranylglycerol-phosphate geranylgeranyltransferase [bacterium]|nr:geranylgeranylglycerol-phosphate geranylgeranyltransferase [bacterium]
MWKKLYAYISILRPVNMIISFSAVYLVLFLSGAQQNPGLWLHALYAALSASLICGGSNIINDFFDIEIDKINRPERAMAQGLISKRTALVYWAVINIIGLSFSIWIGIECFLIALFSVALLFVYSSYLKRTPLMGNLTVSFFTGLAFIYGGVAVGQWRLAVIPAVFAFLFHWGREILKDIEDMEGDRRMLARTFPIEYGIRSALILTTLIFLVLVAVTVWVFLVDFYNLIYFLIVLVGMYPALLYTLISMWRDHSKNNISRLSFLLKIEMFIGLLAIYFGSTPTHTLP